MEGKVLGTALEAGERVDVFLLGSQIRLEASLEYTMAITDTDVYLVNDTTMEALPRFAEAQEIMNTTTEVTNYAGGLHDNADIKTSITDVAVNLLSGTYATGEEAAAAFDALIR